MYLSRIVSLLAQENITGFSRMDDIFAPLGCPWRSFRSPDPAGFFSQETRKCPPHSGHEELHLEFREIEGEHRTILWLNNGVKSGYYNG